MNQIQEFPSETYLIEWDDRWDTGEFDFEISNEILPCPELGLNLGDLCDDGNDLTTNDVVNEDCICEGSILEVGSVCESAGLAVLGENTSSGPSMDNGASNLCFTGATNADWYYYTPEDDVSITISSCLQGVDTRVSIYDGSCSNLNCVASNDDFCEMTPGSQEFASLVTFNAIGGTTYYIEWDDRWSDEGFNWTLEESIVVDQVPDCPTLVGPADGAMNVLIDSENSDQVVFTWLLSESDVQITGLNVLWGSSPNDLVNIGQLGAVETVNIINLSLNTTYFWSIVPYNVIGEAEGCDVFSFTTAEEFQCPELNANVGDVCDDGDTQTINDIIDANCVCAGISIFECPDLQANIGDSCDDGDASTLNDVVDVNCVCQGNPIDTNQTCETALEIGDGIYTDAGRWTNSWWWSFKYLFRRR